MSAKTRIIILIAILVICLSMIVYGTISEGNSITEIMPRVILMALMAVIVIIRIISASSRNKKIDMNMLKEDITSAKEWIKDALESSGYQADFSLESLRDIDRFFDEQKGEDGVLSQNTGRILFGLGVYVGETIISVYGGQWEISDCENETDIKVSIDKDTVLFPVIRIMARYQYGNANSIYTYGCCVRKNEK